MAEPRNVETPSNAPGKQEGKACSFAIDATEVPSLTRLYDRKEEKTESDSEGIGLSVLPRGQGRVLRWGEV